MHEFLRLEAAGGIVLMAFAVVALVWANSPAAGSYAWLMHAHVRLALAGHSLDLSLAHAVSDGAMAVFFLLVGLEIKREVLAGELSSVRRAALPIAGALGGTIVPAISYVTVVAIAGRHEFLRGWAVPMATDIAFALGVLALLGRRAPPTLKIFLVALAIADDLAAVAVIAIFYTSTISTLSLGTAAVLMVGLILLNRLGVRSLPAYIALGVGLWWAVLNSGIHATIAGVVLALTIPATRGKSPSPLERLEHTLHPWVTFCILPLFAFTNAGVPMTAAGGLSGAAPIGVAVGLLIGKPLGVFSAAMLAIRLGFAELPGGVTKLQLFGVSCLCGIGFTMSIFIAALAFDPATLDTAKLAILIASIASACLGTAFLLRSPRG